MKTSHEVGGFIGGQPGNPHFVRRSIGDQIDDIPAHFQCLTVHGELHQCIGRRFALTGDYVGRAAMLVAKRESRPLQGYAGRQHQLITPQPETENPLQACAV